MNTEKLLRHGPFVESLARRLVRDAAEADDLVQETWIAALRARGPIRFPRAWLASAVRKLRRLTARTEARRRARERAVATREARRATSDFVAAEETRRRVVAAVLALDEPYRVPILMRYYDDLPPREIAARLGLDASTVRSRLQRGRDALRARLSRRDPDWARSLVPIAAVASAGTGSVSIPGAAAGLAAILLVGAGAWITWRSLSETDAGIPGRAQASATAPSERVVASESSQTRTEERSLDPGVPRPPGKRAKEITAPVPPGTLVAAFPISGTSPSREAGQHVRAAASGEVVLSGLQDGEHLVVVAGPAHRPLGRRMRSQGGSVVLSPLPLGPGRTVQGRVTDTRGRPLRAEIRVSREPGAERVLTVPGQPERFGWDGRNVFLLETVVSTGSHGHFRAAGLDDGMVDVRVERVSGAHGGVVEEDGWLYRKSVRAPARDVDFTVASSRVELSIVDPEGRPVPGAQIRIGVIGGMEIHRCDAKTHSFGLRMRPGTRHRVAVRRHGFQETEMRLQVPADGESRELRVEMRPRRAGGVLVFKIEPSGTADLPKQYGFQLVPAGGGTPLGRTSSIQAGRCVLADVPAGDYRVHARATGLWLSKGGYLEDLSVNVRVNPGGKTEVLLRPRPTGRLELFVREPNGNTDLPLKIRSFGPGGVPTRWIFLKGGASGYTSATGQLPPGRGSATVAQSILPGTYRLQLHREDGVVLEREVEIRAGRTARLEVVSDGR